MIALVGAKWQQVSHTSPHSSLSLYTPATNRGALVPAQLHTLTTSGFYVFVALESSSSRPHSPRNLIGRTSVHRRIIDGGSLPLESWQLGTS